MKKLVIASVLAIVSMGINAQTEKHFEIELDPLAYALGGASGHVAFTWKNERIQLGYGQLTMPESMQNHENVSESFKAMSFKWDYFIGKKTANQGFFVGPTLDYLFLTYEDQLKDTYKENQLAVGIRGGYKFDLFKKSKALNGLYLTPWLGVNAFTNTKSITLSDKSYDRKAISFFPTIHLGWSF